MKALDELLDLLLPTRCVLCARLGSAMCVECLDGFQLQQHSVTRDRLTGSAVASFGAKEQQVLHAFKEHGQTSLLGFLANPLALILKEIAQGGESPLLVPVPSSRENYKKRGFMPTRLLAKRVCSESGYAGQLSDSLSFRRTVADQSRLDSESRRQNLAGAMASDARVSGRQIILLDDVVTTGSTILEAARAVAAAGGSVVGFLAFAETILKTGSKT